MLPDHQRSFCGVLVLLFFISAGAGSAELPHPLAVAVDYVIDGDSLVVRRNGKEMEVRLWGVDAPEYDQPHSGTSSKALKNLTVGRDGILYVKYRDRYDRYVAVLLIGDLNINQELVKQGHGWVYGRYCTEPVCKRWEHMQAEARVNRRGLWGGRDPVAPWRWKAKR